MKLNWQGEASRIRLGVSTGFDSSTGIFEVPFGAVKRTPYHSRRTAKGEWPAHRWVAVEENGAGVAVINTGSASAEVAGGSIRTTLLRAPVVEYAGMIPDETSSQHGRHEFAFSFLAYNGNWPGAAAVELGQEVNTPVQCFALPTGPLDGIDEIILLDPPTVVLSGVKIPDDDAQDEVVVRVYEAVGQPVKARLSVKGAEKAWRSDLVERKGEAIEVDDGVIAFGLKPFEIGTIRLRKRMAKPVIE
jgi:alpha-mannosidase